MTRVQIPVMTRTTDARGRRRWIPHLDGKPVGDDRGYRTRREAINAAKLIRDGHQTKAARETDNRTARAWYVKYTLDAYALGPFRYRTPKTAADVVEEAKQQFGEYPAEIWPDGQTEEVDEYEYFVSSQATED